MTDQIEGPIKPNDPRLSQGVNIPTEVIEIFNLMILANWNGREASFTQEKVLMAIAKKIGKKAQFVLDQKWLDVEDIFRKAGWKVRYDKPGYNENYEPYFEFKRGPK